MKNICKSQIKNKIRSADIISALFLGLLILLSVLAYSFLKQNLTKEFIAYGFFGLFILIFLLEFIPQFLAPQIPIILAISSGLNVHLVIITSIIATTLGSFAGFKFGEKKGITLMCVLFREKTLKKIFKFWNSYGYVFVFFSALTPLPYFPLIFGSLNLKINEFIKFGMIPRAIGFALLAYSFYYGIEGIKYLYL